VKVRITFHISDSYREGINHYVGRSGKASYAEVREHLGTVVGADEEDLVFDLERDREREQERRS
jgi:hypothetical protein